MNTTTPRARRRHGTSFFEATDDMRGSFDRRQPIIPRPPTDRSNRR